MDEKTQKIILAYLAFILIGVAAGIGASILGEPVYQPGAEKGEAVEAPAVEGN